MMSHSYNDKRKCNLNSRLKFKKFSLKIWALTMLMLFGLQSITVRSQQYPVKLVPVVIPPYSMRLGDYATSTDNKLQLQVLMTDLMEPQHQTGIKFSLEAGLNAVPFARSNDFVVGMNPFMLYPGSNITLTNIDLRALFELQNLGGINAVHYSQPLSDGVYQFCFQAYDYYTKNNLSSKTCATVFLIQYDPPMLNLPQNTEKIQAVSPYAGGSGIVFQWMPRQIAPNTKYIFTLKELWDPGQSPISGFLSSPALWTEETYAPTLYYGLDKTQLIPGKRYAWQVQAKSGNPVLGANPTEDNGVYKNNGLSEIYYFDYVENCTVPTLLMAKNVGRGRVEISWSLAGNASGLYSVQYRKKGSTSEWVSEQSYQSKYIITGLEDQTEYEYRIGSVCGQVQSYNDNAYSYSGIQYFTTDANDTSNNYQCGIMPAVDITNKNPLQTLLGANEVFMAGDFPVTVMSAQGSNGIYSGTGYIVVPYLADTKIKVIFNNIKINTDKKLVEGIIETTYDPNESAVSYASAGIGETFGDQGVKDVFVNFPIGGITYSATPPPGKITITGSDGGSGNSSTTEYPGGKDYTFTDPDGNIWTVDEDGTITQGGAVAQGGASTSTNTDGVTGSGNNATVNQYTAKGIKIEWKENTSGQFAYDTAEKTKLPKDKYPSVKDSENNTVYVPYKATVNKKTELFNAKVSITDPALKDAKIVFKTLSIGKAIEATEINKTDTERNYQLKLPGTFDYAEEEVIAVLMPKDSTSKQKVISSFRLVHLSPKTVDVSLVPLDVNSQSKLQSQGDKLNQVYKRIGITFNVTKDPVLDISSVVSGDTINSEDADLMSTYSPQQQQINVLYKGTDARYVLFVTDKKSSTGQKGYMRLNGQFGYVYNNAQDKTGAHELGHGVFKLEHPWKAYGTTQSATPLLMDYSTGEELSHLDWKQINDPAFKLYAFQGQSSGEFNGGYVVSPDYKIFTIGSDNTIIDKFTYGSNIELSNDGTLPGFKLNGIEYWWSNGKYVKSETDTFGYSIADVSNNLSSVKDKWMFFFYDKKNNCGSGTYVSIKVSDFISSGKTLKEFITSFSDVPLGTKPNEVEKGKKELVGCSGNEATWKKENSHSNGTGGNGSAKDFFDKVKASNGNNNADVNGSIIDFSGGFTAEQIQKMVQSLNLTTSETGIKGRIIITDKSTTDTNRQKAQSIFDTPKSDEIVIWLDVKDATTKDYQIKINAGSGLPQYKNASVQKIINEITAKKGWFEVDEFWTIKFNPLTAIFDGLSYVIKQLEVPEEYWNAEKQDYNPILYYVSQVDPTSMSVFVSDQILQQYGVSGDASKVLFATKCGVWNGLVGQVAGLADTAGLLSDLLTGGDRLGQVWEGVKKLDIFCTSSTNGNVCIWTIIKKAHQGNKYQVSHQIGKDISEVLTIVVSFAKAGKLAKISQVADALDPVNYVMRVSGKVIQPVLSATGKTFKFVLKEGVDFVKRLNVKVTPQGFGCGFPIVKINITLKSKIDNLTDAQLKTKVEAEINTQGGIDKLPVDENGNRMVEIDVDGEKVPVVVGTDENLGKVINTPGNIDFSLMDIPKALEHVKFRDLTNLARRDIVGLHDAVEFFKLRITKALGNRSFQFPIGKTLDEVDEIVILAERNHSTIPGVKTIEYRVPSTDGKLTQKINGVDVNKGYTTGATKGVNTTEDYVKTIYDPAIWPDAKLERALKESLQDVANKNGGNIPYKFNGVTSEGYKIEGYFKDGKVSTFYFEVN